MIDRLHFLLQPVFLLFYDTGRAYSMNQVQREEKKFLISVAEYLRKSCELEKILMQDPHNGSDGYLIRSLYFDTLYDNDFFEKQAGIETRRKIRLRCYDPNQDYAMLERRCRKTDTL